MNQHKKTLLDTSLCNLQSALANPSLNVVGLELDELQRSLPTSMILPFRKITIGFIKIKCNISVSAGE